jgi:predicted HicB family RNase H-like nuclease
MIEDTDALERRRESIKKYLSQFKEIRIRVLPEEHEEIVAHAKKMGDKSTVAFISRAIHETMERDRQNKGIEG